MRWSIGFLVIPVAKSPCHGIREYVYDVTGVLIETSKSQHPKTARSLTFQDSLAIAQKVVTFDGTIRAPCEKLA